MSPDQSIPAGRLLRIIQEQFALDCDGVHGSAHWQRVRDNGLRLAGLTGANPGVIELFALFHDSRRLNDCRDPGHGARGALFAQTLAGSAFELAACDLKLLMDACHGHSEGLMTGDITVLACWDADRLDLGRVGIRPSPQRLCTEAARDPDILDWAYQRSIRPATR
ncbi:MAG: hypothetical protein NTY77_19165 [Elusimicrobia bacterium]|nr:hypothetical protein [Elusimicrobiota bacterium]